VKPAPSIAASTTACQHVDEEEGEDADGEHRQADPGLGAEAPDPGDRQSQEDGEAGDRAEQGRLREGQS
jgi:hypothetical protein